MKENSSRVSFRTTSINFKFVSNNDTIFSCNETAKQDDSIDFRSDLLVVQLNLV